MAARARQDLTGAQGGKIRGANGGMQDLGPNALRRLAALQQPGAPGAPPPQPSVEMPPAGPVSTFAPGTGAPPEVPPDFTSAYRSLTGGGLQAPNAIDTFNPQPLPTGLPTDEVMGRLSRPLPPPAGADGAGGAGAGTAGAAPFPGGGGREAAGGPIIGTRLPGLTDPKPGFVPGGGGNVGFGPAPNLFSPGNPGVQDRIRQILASRPGGFAGAAKPGVMPPAPAPLQPPSQIAGGGNPRSRLPTRPMAR